MVMVSLSDLNSTQKIAVQWVDGPLLVLAGPGSGKTRVLTQRIAKLINENRDSFFKVLGLTFTNKAATEMRERIELLVPNANDRTLLTTFHSFSVNLLRQHGHHIGLRPDFTILTQKADRESLLSEAISRAQEDFSEGLYRSEQLLSLVTNLLDNNVRTDEAVAFLQQRGASKAHEIGSTYQQYRQLMIEKNWLDFEGVIAEAIRLLEDRPFVRQQVHRIYPYICVDEFQDTTYAQYLILKYITDPDSKNLFVVADEDQIIYQWNGANPNRLNELRQDFDMFTLQLPENYRCPAEVIAIANKLIQHNVLRDPLKEDLIAHKSVSNETRIRVKSFKSFDEEASWVASDIASRIDGPHHGFAVIARTRRLLEEVALALANEGMTSYLGVRKDEFSSSPVAWLHSMLRLAHARQDREYLRRVCQSFFDFEGTRLIVSEVVSAAAAAEGDYLRAWHHLILQRSGLGSHTVRFLTESVPKLIDRLDFQSFVTDCLDWFEIEYSYNPPPQDVMAEYREEVDTLNKLIGEVKGEIGQSQITLHVLLQGLDLRSKTPRPPDGAVPCFTIHLSKGMEFDHVYLVGLVEDQLPSWAAINKGADSHEIEEERRSCFVAITRVQESLTLTYSEEIFGWMKRPSRFLSEMGLLP